MIMIDGRTAWIRTRERRLAMAGWPGRAWAAIGTGRTRSPTLDDFATSEHLRRDLGLDRAPGRCGDVGRWPCL